MSIDISKMGILGILPGSRAGSGVLMLIGSKVEPPYRRTWGT